MSCAWARKQYWSDGSGDHQWSTDENWSGGESDNAEFRGKYFNPESTGYLIEINGDQTASYRLHVCGVGSENTPLVFRNTAKDKTLRIGASYNDLTGYYIANNEGDAWLQLECGKYTTFNHSNARWNIGSADYKGYVIVDKDATLVSIGKMFLNQGTVYVKSGGKMTLNTWCAVGALASKTGKVEIDGGEVESTANCMTIGDVDNSTGIVVIKNGGRLSNTGSSGTGITVGQKESGTLEVDSGKVELGQKTLQLCAEETSTATVTIKNGGIVKTKGIVHGSGTGGATITIDGGTLQATAAGTFIPANNMLNVTVGSNGGTIDNGSYNVTIASTIGGVGGMTFTGGGTTTLNGANTYEGATTIEVGTAVVVASTDHIGDGLVLTLPAEALADGVYTVFSVNGDETLEGFTLPEAPENCSLRLSADKKSLLCIYGDPQNTWIGGASGSLSDAAGWSLGFVPGSGDSCVIGNAVAATLTVGDTFAPSAITFTSGSESVTIDGRDLTGITAITNLSSASHTINAKVYFAGNIQVKQAAMGDTDDVTKAHVTFAGGAHAAPGCSIENGDTSVYSRCMFGEYYLYPAKENPWTAINLDNGRRNCLAAESSLHLPYAGSLHEFYLGRGSVLKVGDVSLADDNRLCLVNLGEYVITNEFKVSGSNNKDGYAAYYGGTDASDIFKIEKATCEKTDSWTFYFAQQSLASSGTYYFGKGGINFGTGSGYFGIGVGKANDAQTIRPWYGDFTIAAGSGNSSFDIYMRRSVTFNTDDEKGVGRTITLDARLKFQHSPSFTVAGKGKVLVNSNSIANNEAQPPVTVKDTATLAIKPGAGVTENSVTVESGATLEVAGSGTVEIKGPLTCKDGSTLKFTFTKRLEAPKLSLSEVPSLGSVKIDVAGVRPAGTEHTILTWPEDTVWPEGFDIASAFSLVDNSPSYLRRIFVENNELVLDVKPLGTYISIR